MTLVTSASRKLPLLRAIRDDLRESMPSTRVLAADADSRCLAAFAWDAFVTMPRIDAASPADVIAWIAAHSDGRVIPTRDADVLFLARNRAALAAAGTDSMVADVEAVETCLDKVRFAQVLADAGLPAIPTFTEPGSPVLTDAIVVKERHGAGSRGLAVGVDRAAAEHHGSLLDAPIFQPFIPGRELSIDAYRSRTGTVLGIVVRTRDLVISGESQVSTVIDPAPYASLVVHALDAIGLSGHCVLQVIDGPTGPVLLECNARLGGASTLALAAGLRTPSWFMREAAGDDPADLAFHPRIGLRLIRTPWDTISDPRP